MRLPGNHIVNVEPFTLRVPVNAEFRPSRDHTLFRMKLHGFLPERVKCQLMFLNNVIRETSDRDALLDWWHLRVAGDHQTSAIRNHPWLVQVFHDLRRIDELEVEVVGLEVQEDVAPHDVCENCAPWAKIAHQ